MTTKFIEVDMANDEGRFFPFFRVTLNSTTGLPEYGDPIQTEREEDCPGMVLRDPIPFIQKRVEKKKTKVKYVVNPKSHAMQPVEEDVKLSQEEKKKEKREYVDFMVAKIQNFKSGGVVLENTLDNKVRLLDKPAISLYVSRCIEILQESGVKESEEEKKTSPSTSNSKETKQKPK